MCQAVRRWPDPTSHIFPSLHAIMWSSNDLTGAKCHLNPARSCVKIACFLKLLFFGHNSSDFSILGMKLWIPRVSDTRHLVSKFQVASSNLFWDMSLNVGYKSFGIPLSVGTYLSLHLSHGPPYRVTSMYYSSSCRESHGLSHRVCPKGEVLRRSIEKQQ